MSGKTSELTTYLTPRRVLRYQVAAADSAPSDALPLVHLDVAEHRAGTALPATVGSVNGFGYNAVLALSVLYAPSAATVAVHTAPLADGSGTAHANICVWMLADVEGRGYAGSPSDYAALTPRWVLVHLQSVSCNTLIQLRDIPAAKYCVTVSFITPGGTGDVGTVTIVEQHAE